MHFFPAGLSVAQVDALAANDEAHVTMFAEHVREDDCLVRCDASSGKMTATVVEGIEYVVEPTVHVVVNAVREADGWMMLGVNGFVCTSCCHADQVVLHAAVWAVQEGILVLQGMDLVVHVMRQSTRSGTNEHHGTP